MPDCTPELGRAVMTAREAGRVLGKDPRTIRKMIESGQLAGGAEQGPERKRWFVYADQIATNPTTATLSPSHTPENLHAENARLQQELNDMRGRLASSEESVRLLLASQAAMRDALNDYQRSVDDLLAGTSAFRDAALRFESAATNLQSSNSKLNTIASSYSDALSQHFTPAHAGPLTGAGE